VGGIAFACLADLPNITEATMSQPDQARAYPNRRDFLTAAGYSALAATVAGAVPLAPPDAQPPNLKAPPPPSKKAGWAIVGLGELALNQVMPAFAECDKSRPVALVSGHPDKARQTAQHYGLNPGKIYNYDNFDRIKDDPDVQVVYIILPNHMHAEYTIRAPRPASTSCARSRWRSRSRNLSG
jgi:GFO/IDH/MocA oxidoreductase family protein